MLSFNWNHFNLIFIEGLEYIRFDYKNMKFAFQIVIPTIIGRLIFDSLPFDSSRHIKEDAENFALRLFGNNTSLLRSTLCSFFFASKFMYYQV